jgi:hypothetical protein
MDAKQEIEQLKLQLKNLKEKSVVQERSLNGEII